METIAKRKTREEDPKTFSLGDAVTAEGGSVNLTMEQQERHDDIVYATEYEGETHHHHHHHYEDEEEEKKHEEEKRLKLLDALRLAIVLAAILLVCTLNGSVLFAARTLAALVYIVIALYHLAFGKVQMLSVPSLAVAILMQPFRGILRLEFIVWLMVFALLSLLQLLILWNEHGKDITRRWHHWKRKHLPHRHHHHHHHH